MHAMRLVHDGVHAASRRDSSVRTYPPPATPSNEFRKGGLRMNKIYEASIIIALLLLSPIVFALKAFTRRGVR